MNCKKAASICLTLKSGILIPDLVLLYQVFIFQTMKHIKATFSQFICFIKLVNKDITFNVLNHQFSNNEQKKEFRLWLFSCKWNLFMVKFFFEVFQWMVWKLKCFVPVFMHFYSHCYEHVKIRTPVNMMYTSSEKKYIFTHFYCTKIL